MKATSLQRNLSLYQFTRKRVEAIGTVLRNASMLPKGGRGIHAPNVTCEQAAVFALAVASAETVESAAKSALILANLVDVTGNVRLVHAIAEAICTPGVADNIRHVRVVVESKMAEITMRDGTVKSFFEIGQWQTPGFSPDAQGQAFVGRIGHIGGAALAQIALDHIYNDAADEGELIPE